MGSRGEGGLVRPNRGESEKLIHAARDTAPVAGLTHNFYRYPARFSPTFVRAAIHAFTEPGDWVIDPFAGGGTTLVESLAAGRNVLGVDISSLAAFVCEAKTLIIDDRDEDAVRRWVDRLPNTINMHSPGYLFADYSDSGYFRNIEGREYWRLRKAVEQALASVGRIRRSAAQVLSRCIVLRTAQWALDARKTLPSVKHFRQELIKNAKVMMSGALEFRARVEENAHGRRPKIICLNRTSAGLENEPKITLARSPSLVLTSPPYPGIHVLYHRWQVDGRKEAPAPFWIANKLDGAGASHYTMGGRHDSLLQAYFEGLEANFRSIAKICNRETVIIQVVAFSEPRWQLPRYLEVMNACGLREIVPWDLHEGDGRLWRKVPNRRWHAQQQQRAPGSREIVLVHRKIGQQ